MPNRSARHPEIIRIKVLLHHLDMLIENLRAGTGDTCTEMLAIRTRHLTADLGQRLYPDSYLAIPSNAARMAVNYGVNAVPFAPGR